MTVARMHTVAETRELIEQKQRDINAYDKAFTAISPKWSKSAPTSHDDWAADWKKFKSRWISANVAAGSILTASSSASIFPDSLTPAEPAFEIILRALQVSPGRHTKGDFQELINRWSAMGLPSPDIITNQPDTIDLDLEVFKKADQVTKAIERPGGIPIGFLIGGGLGALGLYMILRK